MTKKLLAILTYMIAMVALILLHLYKGMTGLPVNIFIFTAEAAFVSMAIAIFIAIIIILICKHEFIKKQLTIFNKYKHLLKLLVKRDFIARYRKSVLGVLWSLLNPLLTMMVMTLVFSHFFRFNIENFPVYFLGGFIIYGFFGDSTTVAMHSIITSEGIIKKIYVPKYIFPVSKVISSLVNLLFSFIAFLFVFIVTGVSFKPTMLLLPVPILYTFIFSLGVAMLLAAAAVFFRDLIYLYGVFMTLLMYLTPLFYPVEMLPEWLQPYLVFNPLFHFIKYVRELTLHGTVPDLWTNLVCLGYALAALCCGAYVFKSKQERFILGL